MPRPSEGIDLQPTKSPQSMRPAALIFDVDGTLAETEDLHRLAFNASFAEAGLAWSWDLALYKQLLRVTGGKERIAHYAQTLGLTLDAETIGRLHAAKTACYTRLMEQGAVALRPGIQRLIDEARRCGIKLAIATTTSLPNIESLLTAALGPDAMGWFAAIAAGDMVRAKKPAPDVYRLALEQLGLAAVDCIAFEDSLNGLNAALGAGIQTVVTPSEFTIERVFPGAVSVLDHLGEPNRHCTILAGRAPAAGFVTIADLGGWLRQP